MAQSLPHKVVPREVPRPNHLVRFYDQPDVLLDEVYEFLADALRNGGTAVLIATPEHVATLSPLLQNICDASEKQQTSYLFVLDAAETLSQFMVSGLPDPARFMDFVGPVVSQAAERGGPIHLFGEMVTVLCAQGNYDAAIELEKIGNELLSAHCCRIFCAYPKGAFASNDKSLAFQQVCQAHNHICTGENLPLQGNSEDIRLSLAMWEQKSWALEAEIARRRKVEATLQRREAELTDFVENAAEGLHRVAGDGTILWANRAELDLLGYDEKDYVGRHIAEFHVDPPVIESILVTLSAGETLRDQPARLRCSDGTIKHVLINSNGCFQDGKLSYTRCLTRDATDRVARQTAQDQLRATLMNSPIATALLIGPQHIFQIANKRYIDLVTCESLLGLRFADALPAWHHRGLTELLDRVFQQGQSFATEEYTLQLDVRGELEERVFNLSLEPLRDLCGSVEGIIVSLVDRTFQVRDREAQENALRERNNLLVQLEEASRAKDEFLAMLGHELRNPLAPIVTALQLMRMRGVTGTEREQDVIQRQVDHLIQLIADLLDISKVTRGMIDLRKDWISVTQVLTKAVEMASPLLEQRSHRLAVDVPKQLFIDGDAVRLAQVVSNLLSNAARYTPIGGEIHLSARLEVSDYLVISVRDNGIGISADLLPRIFGLFIQGARDGGRSEGGLGIGLALVKSFVELHGGTASVSSKGQGFGSEFTVRLPVGKAPEIVQSTKTDLTAPSEKGSLKILIVDDNVDAGETLSMLLNYVGHTVEVINCPTLALQCSRTFVPDIAILDIGLPVMDGYELVAQLQQKSEWHNCVFVALSGYGQALDTERSRIAGFREHFVKPIDPLALLRFVDAFGAPTL